MGSVAIPNSNIEYRKGAGVQAESGATLETGPEISPPPADVFEFFETGLQPVSLSVSKVEIEQIYAIWDLSKPIGLEPRSYLANIFKLIRSAKGGVRRLRGSAQAATEYSVRVLGDAVGTAGEQANKPARFAKVFDILLKR
jgi:hypothetical protein